MQAIISCALVALTCTQQATANAAFRISGAGGGAEAVNGAWCANGEKNGKPQYRNYKWGAVIWETDGHFAHSDLGTPGTPKWTIIVDAHHRYYNEQDSAVPPASGWKERPGYSSGRIAVSYEDSNMPATCPRDFPSCHAPDGNCLSASCSGVACSWVNGKNYIEGYDWCGADCTGDYQVPTGVAACEGHNYDSAQCASVGCCNYQNGACWSSVGQSPCPAPTTTPTPATTDHLAARFIVSGAQGFAKAANGPWCKTGEYNGKPQYQNAAWGWVIWENGNGKLHSNDWAYLNLGTSGVPKWTIVVDSNHRYYNEQDSAVPPETGWKARDYFSHGEMIVTYPESKMPTTCPRDFPKCYAMDGNCLSASCSNLACEWVNGESYIQGYDWCGADCTGDYQVPTGVAACEGHNYDAAQCSSVGCCAYSGGACRSSVGQNPCPESAPAPTPAPTPLSPERFVISGASGFARKANGPWCYNGNYNDKPQYRNAAWGWVVWENGNGHQHSNDWAYLNMGTSGVSKWTIVVDSHHRYYHENDSATPPETGWIARDYHAHGELVLTFTAPSKIETCPIDFPICSKDNGNCVIASCSTFVCEWLNGVNYIQGYDWCGAKCAGDYRAPTGVVACEGHNYNAVQCASVGCCSYQNGACLSLVGQNPCPEATPSPTPTPAPVPAQRLVISGARGGAEAANGPWCFNGDYNGKPKYRNSKFGWVVWENGNGDQHGNDWAYSKMGTPGVAKWTIVVDDHHRYYNEQDSAEPPASGWRERPGYSSGRINLSYQDAQTLGTCPIDFPSCARDNGNCHISSCANVVCEWSKGGNYIDGHDHCGATCMGDYIFATFTTQTTGVVTAGATEISLADVDNLTPEVLPRMSLTISDGINTETKSIVSVRAGAGGRRLAAGFVTVDSPLQGSYDAGTSVTCTEESPATTTTTTNFLFFSSYLEGSGNNQYLEIYNKGPAAAFLDDFAFPSTDNGHDDGHEYWNTFTGGAILQPRDFYVIAHPDADAAILAKANQTHKYLSDGNDAFALVYGNEEEYTIIDSIGQFGQDPGSGWDVCGVTDATKDHSLLRKPTWDEGNRGNWEASYGSNADDCAWYVLAADVFKLHSYPMTTSIISAPTPASGTAPTPVPSPAFGPAAPAPAPALAPTPAAIPAPTPTHSPVPSLARDPSADVIQDNTQAPVQEKNTKTDDAGGPAVIVAIVAGVVSCVACIAAVAFFLLYRRAARQAAQNGRGEDVVLGRPVDESETANLEIVDRPVHATKV